MTRIRWPDVALAGVVTAGIVWEIVLTFPPAPGHVVTAVLYTASGVALAWRRVAPLPVALVPSAALLSAGLLGPTVESFSFVVALFVTCYSATAYSSGPRTALWPGAALVTTCSVYNWMNWPGLVNLMIAWIQLGAAFGLGMAMRRVRLTATVSAQRAELAEQVREQHAAAAVAAERARIARDLHDVVAHAISVIVLHARGGRRMLTIDPDESRAAFDTVEQLAEQALTDLRHMLGVIRSAPDGDLAPQPSLRHLDALISQLSRPGLAMVSDVDGDVDRLPASIDIAGYRIVQESLTNVLRHAAAATTASVRIRVEPAALRIEVSDDGTGTPGGEPGFGLLGMRERVAVYGGTLDAGAEPAGGYRIRACLPVPA